jgi:hypothetical protein
MDDQREHYDARTEANEAEVARDAIPTTAEALANVFEQNAKHLQEELNALSDGGRNVYIITVADLPVKVIITETQGSSVSVQSLRDCTRYCCLATATKRARTIRNGKGDRGEVHTLHHAYVTAIADLFKQAQLLRDGLSVLKLTEAL